MDFCLTLRHKTKQNLKCFSMATKNLLSNEERLELIEKYKNDKFNAPPANIKDETLINNYGTDEQKARVLQPQADEKPKGTENEAAASEAGNETGTQSAADTGVNEGQIQNAGNSNDTVVGDGTGQALPEITNPVTDQVNAGATAAPVVDKNQEYVKEFNRHVDLFLEMLNDTLTTEQLKAANDAKELQNAQDAKDAEQIKANAKAMQTLTQDTNVTLVNKKDFNNKIVVSQFTYEKFLSKDPEWELMPKPPVETIGH